MKEASLTMTRREWQRYEVVNKVLAGSITGAGAAQMTGLSERQVWRLVAGVRKAGAGGVRHGLRGRRSNHAVGEEVKAQAAQIVAQKYGDFGPTLAQEYLAAGHGLRLSVSVVRQVMMGSGQWRGRRRGERHRAKRERRAAVGMMIQVDGSVHDWFEGRRGKAVLLAFIDDASSRLLHAEFVEGETTRAMMVAMWRYIEKHGVPGSVYVDRDSIYVVNRQATIEEELRDVQPQTQFDRAMEEVGVTVILARSPQAKGRVERLFQTLQDRLVKALRLRGINTITAANEYLRDEYCAEHNARFSVTPATAEDAHHAVPAEVCLADVFTIRSTRVVKNDYTVAYRTRCYQVARQQAVRVRPGAVVTVCEYLDGRLAMTYKQTALMVQDVTGLERPKTRGGRRVKQMPQPARIERWRPAADHPWRSFVIGRGAPACSASSSPMAAHVAAGATPRRL